MRPRLLTVGLLVAVGLTGEPAAIGSLGPVNGRIAYERHGFLYGGSEVWTMNQDGSTLRRVAPGREPSWSADGARLVLVSERELVVVDGDGSEPRVVEIVDRPSGDVGHPALSPDGSTIAFGSGDGLYVVPAAGGAARRIAVARTPAPAWSPDGTRIAFVGPTGRIRLVDAEGAGAHDIGTVNVHSGDRVAWSPDGSRLAYPDFTTGGISTVSLDGERRLLTGDLATYARSIDPAWSPDGARIAFVDAFADICVVNADGTGLGRLTYAPRSVGFGGESANVHPAWQPLAGGEPSGEPVAPSGPPASWDRGLSWAHACSHQFAGLTLSVEGGPGRTHTGAVVAHRLRLENRGALPIGDVGAVGVVVQPIGGVRILSLAAERGTCEARTCHLGALFPGEHVDAVLRILVRAAGDFQVTFSSPDVPDVPGPDLYRSVWTRADRCTIRGTRRADALSGSRRRDVLCGLEGNDRLRPGGGADVVHAGPGRDVAEVRDGRADAVWCGDGVDTVVADHRDEVADDCERVTRR